MRCPATKFITHTLSHLSFLILLAAATFRLEDKAFKVNTTAPPGVNAQINYLLLLTLYTLTLNLTGIIYQDILLIFYTSNNFLVIFILS